MDGDNILTIEQLVTAFPAFGEKTVRWWIYNGKSKHLKRLPCPLPNGKSNDFEACLIRIGSRIYIDRKRFVDWLKSHRPVRDVPKDVANLTEELEPVE